MMAHNWRICMLLATTFVLKTSYAEDLLDQYVKHVERRMNGINGIDDPNIKFNGRKNRVSFINSHISRKLQSATEEVTETKDGDIFSVDLLDFLKRPLEEESRERRDASSDILWTHSESLDKDSSVVLRWQPRHQEILFRVEARTKGYVGIGFSPDGKMENADIVLAWVEDDTGKAFLMDCHGVPKSQGSAPVKDEIDNYTLMKGIQNNTHTIIEFRRVLDTCDQDDYVLTGDTVRVIWALHDRDPPHGAEMVYHGERRGSQSLHLLGPPPIPRMPTGHSRHWDVVFEDFKIEDDMNTIYWCKVFKGPVLNSKQHIVGFEPIIGSNHENMVHHMIIHECELDYRKDDMEKWEAYSKEKGRFCYNDMPSQWEKCLTPLVAWGIGSKGENFPNHVGVPLTNKKHAYYMLEVHFDNPLMKTAVDTTGLRLHYTSELRENEGGILITGVAPSTLHFIPPYQEEYKTAGYCSLNCTQEVIPKTGVNVVSVMLHSHTAARKLRLLHIRSGKELIPLAEDNRYDFNYQQSRMLIQDTLILPGDGLITECTYSTKERDKPTLGGYSTKEEMCLAFVLHYPRTQLAGCYSIPPVKSFFKALGIEEFYGKDMADVERDLLEGNVEAEVLPTTTSKPFINKPGDELSREANQKAIAALRNAKEYSIEGENSAGKNVFDRLVIKEPAEFKNLTFTDHLQHIPYNETLLTQKLEEYFYKGLHLTFCRKKDDSLAIREAVEKLPEFTKYVKRLNVQCSHRSKMQPIVEDLNNSASTHQIIWISVVLAVILTIS